MEQMKGIHRLYAYICIYIYNMYNIKTRFFSSLTIVKLLQKLLKQ